jgi:hypothetical protein
MLYQADAINSLPAERHGPCQSATDVFCRCPLALRTVLPAACVVPVQSQSLTAKADDVLYPTVVLIVILRCQDDIVPN